MQDRLPPDTPELSSLALEWRWKDDAVGSRQTHCIAIISSWIVTESRDGLPQKSLDFR